MTDAPALALAQTPGPTRPASSPLWPLALFLVLAGLAWWANTLELHVPSDHVNIATMVLKDQHPELFRGDLGFDDDATFRFYTPVYRWLMAKLAGWTGSLLTAPQPLTPLLVFIFLAGSYWLFHRLTGSVLASLLVAVFSLPQWKAIYDSWGLDVPMNMLPRSMFTASAPWLALGLIQARQRLGLQAILFFIVGLLANLHPVSAFGFAQILLFVVLWEGRFRPRAFLRAGVLGLVAAVPTIWFALTYWQGTQLEGTTTLSYAVVQDMFKHRLAGFYPIPGERLVDTIRGLTVPGALAGWWLWRRIRCLSQADQWLAAFALGAILAAFAGTAVIQVLSRLTETKPISFDQFRTLRFLYLPVFALACGQVAWLLQRTAPGKAPLVKSASLLLVVGFTLGTFWPSGTELGQRLNQWLGRSRDRAGEQRSLRAMAEWVRTRTPEGAVVDCDSPLFRFLAERPLVYCDKDGGILIYSGNKRVLEWHRRFWEQHRLKSGDSQGRAEFARKHGARYMALNRDWPPPAERCVYENQHFKLYQLAPATSEP